MTIKQGQLEISGIQVEVVRKEIKNLHLGVYPPHGRVRVSVPLRVDDETVRLAVIARLGWIRRQQAHFAEQARQSQREMVTGESVYVEGRRYRLDVVAVDAVPQVTMRTNACLALQVRPGASRKKREQVLYAWYRARLADQIPALIAKWEPVVGVQVAEWRMRKMKTRWGSCTIEARRIWLNVELAKKPRACLEYIVVHELVHLRERHHNARFQALMDAVMPQWRLLRDELNRAPLAHETWAY